jgi:hypothetical protein
MYYVGTKEFASLSEAVAYASSVDGTVTSQPVGASSTDGGMLSTPDTSTDTTYDPSTTDGWNPNAGSTNEPMEETNPTPEGASSDTSTTTSPTSSTFTLFRGSELGDANPTALLGSRDAEQVTESELQSYFNEDGSAMLRTAFGSFDNYLAYMTEREGLIQSGDYNVGNWNEYTGALTEDELMILEGEDLTQHGDDANSTQEELYLQQMGEQQAAYENWLNSDANDALLSKYGVGGTLYNGDGDRYRWNGSAYVKTNKIDDSVNIGDIAKLGFAVALSVVATPALASQLSATLGTVGANAAASSIVNSASQLLLTGQIDPEGALMAGATSVLSQAAMGALRGKRSPRADRRCRR